MSQNRVQLLPSVRDKLRLFLDEDLGFGDITSRSLRISGQAEATLFPRTRCILSGGTEAAAVFEQMGVDATILQLDGAKVERNSTVIKLSGEATAILAAERVALNLIARMSGIATLTSDLVTTCRKINPDVRVACTRKTTPGLRYFEKQAVIAGGGDPHRWRLDDAVLIKDNHLALIPSVEKAVRRARFAGFTKKIEIEVETREQAREAARARADIIMLDNFSPEEAAECAAEVRELHPDVLIELSGGINPESIQAYAAIADVISLGWLTHSVQAIDFSLDMTPL